MVELVRVSDEGFGTRILPETFQMVPNAFSNNFLNNMVSKEVFVIMHGDECL